METIDNFNTENQTSKRPVFITVLCILTFVGAGLYFLSSLWGIGFHEQSRKSMMMMNSVQSNFKNFNPFTQFMSASTESLERFFEWSLYSNILNLINSILCLVGALMMWKLKKVGFFVYAGAQILPIIGGIGLYMAVKGVPLLGFSASIGAIFTIVICIGFVVMYAVNLKHFKH